MQIKYLETECYSIDSVSFSTSLIVCIFTAFINRTTPIMLESSFKRLTTSLCKRAALFKQSFKSAAQSANFARESTAALTGSPAFWTESIITLQLISLRRTKMGLASTPISLIRSTSRFLSS